MKVRSEDIFAQGYAVPAYDISTLKRTWRYRTEEYELPMNAVRLCQLPGVPFHVGHIDDVRQAAGV